MTNPTLSLLDRAGLDRNDARRQLARGLEGADDGELYVEYSQSEMLLFDNGRLKQATYNTDQGFGLRAVKDDAVGYAHSTDLSEAALGRAADAVRAVKAGYSGQYAAPPGRTNVRLYGDDNPLGAPAFETKVRLLETIDAYAARQGPARAPGFGVVGRQLAGDRDPACRRRDLPGRAAAGAGQRVRGGGRRRPPGIRQPRLRRTRGIRALPRDQCLAGHRRRKRCARR